MRLNLGCCDRHEHGFLNVDVVPPADILADLNAEWPWEDDSVDEIHAYDVIEHLKDKISTMNEAWRVLKPSGRLHIIVPTTDGRGAFQDPTHVSYWTPNDFDYYEHGNFARERLGRHYGIDARFKVVSKVHQALPDKVWKLDIVLEAVK